MTSESLIEVRDRPAERQFVITVDGEDAGVATYRLRDSVITFLHTEIRPAFGGRGLGARLATGALDDARRRGLGVVPICPFIAKFIGEHPAYQDLLTGAGTGPP
jgi:predicted GNAT family acetyltransferase